MFLSSIFKKYKDREYRILVVKELVEGLNIDDRQKNLYIESLWVLDDESLDRFYRKLTSVLDILEDDYNTIWFKKQTQEVYNINKQELIDKKQEMNSFNLILDNI
jgi:hypothetical protein